MSVVDRSVITVLNNPDDTPSRRQGISVQLERQHRLYGTSLVLSACKLLKLHHASTNATACTIFHRFYHRVSLKQHCIWSVSMACLLLATKMENDPTQQRTIRHIILIFDHLYRKRHGCLSGNAERDILPLNKIGPVWKEYYELILEMENRILRELGFTLYWIPDSHPHKFLWEFLRVLFDLEENKKDTIAAAAAAAAAAAVAVTTSEKEEENKNNKDKEQKEETTQHHHHQELAQRGWNYCNDSCRLDLCVRFDSEVMTCAAIYLAASDLKFALPLKPKPWWELFLGSGTSSSSSQDLSNAANAIVGLVECERNNPIGKQEEGFLPSLIPGGSFNDKDSFIWESRVAAAPPASAAASAAAAGKG